MYLLVMAISPSALFDSTPVVNGKTNMAHRLDKKDEYAVVQRKAKRIRCWKKEHTLIMHKPTYVMYSEL